MKKIFKSVTDPALRNAVVHYTMEILRHFNTINYIAVRLMGRIKRKLRKKRKEGIKQRYYGKTVYIETDIYDEYYLGKERGDLPYTIVLYIIYRIFYEKENARTLKKEIECYLDYISQKYRNEGDKRKRNGKGKIFAGEGLVGPIDIGSFLNETENTVRLVGIEFGTEEFGRNHRGLNYSAPTFTLERLSEVLPANRIEQILRNMDIAGSGNTGRVFFALSFRKFTELYNKRKIIAGDRPDITLFNYTVSFAEKFTERLFGRKEFNIGKFAEFYTSARDTENRNDNQHNPENLSAPLTVYKDVPGLMSIPKYLKKNLVFSDAYRYGLVRILDPAGYISIYALSDIIMRGFQTPKTVWDMCSSPGVKLSVFSDIIGTFYPTEISGHYIPAAICTDYIYYRLVSEYNYFKLYGPGYRAGIIMADATIPPLRRPYGNGFDIVLLDAPCTGSGTFGAHPELKWRQSHSFLERHTDLQKKLLDIAATFCRKEGIIWYCTCSLYPEEGERMISAFLRGRGKEFALVELPKIIPRTEYPTERNYEFSTYTFTGIGKEKYTTHDNIGAYLGRFTPHPIGIGGFFVSILIKKKDRCEA